MIVTIAQKRAMTGPYFNGVVLVAGADLEEGKGKDKNVSLGAVLYKIIMDDDLEKDNTFTLSDPKEAVGIVFS
jgi:hypothetical protein